MIKKLVTILIVAFAMFFSFAASAGAQEDGPVSPVETISIDGFASTAGFATGAGHSAPVNTSPFFGLKLGVGITASAPMSLLSSFSDPEALFSSIPLPNTNAYIKVGLPSFDFFLLKNADVGLRVGVLPGLDLEEMGLFPLTLNGFQIGGEFRSALIKKGIFSLDVRGSFDYFSGEVVLGLEDLGLALDWSGVSIGLRALTGIDVNWLFGLRVGAGMNLNIGRANFAITGIEELTGSPQNTTAAYQPFDLRVMAGVKVLIIDVFAEYGVVSQQLGVTLMPITLKF